MKRISHYLLQSLVLVFTVVADISTSTSTGILWYETDCPEELWK